MNPEEEARRRHERLHQIARQILADYPDLECRVRPAEAGLVYRVILTDKTSGSQLATVSVELTLLEDNNKGSIERRIARAALWAQRKKDAA